MNEDRPKYAQAFAHTFVQDHLEKPFFGKQYMKRGVFWSGCGFAFQQCGLLGRLFTDKPIPFIYAMCADKGKEESVLDFLDSGVSGRVLPYLSEKTGFHHLVQYWQKERLNSTDSDTAFFSKYAMDKLPPLEAMKHLSLWTSYGTYLGLKYPTAIIKLYEATYQNEDQEEWDLLYKSGIVSTPKQERLSVEELTSEAKESFSEFCSQFYPELMSVLFQK